MCILHTTLLLTKRAIAAKILKYIKDTKTLLKKSSQSSTVKIYRIVEPATIQIKNVSLTALLWNYPMDC